MIEFIFVFLGIFIGFCCIAYSVFFVYLNRYEIKEIIFDYLSKKVS